MTPYINNDLGPDPSYPWINISWTLGAAVLVSVAGRLADIFGRRPFMLFGASVAFVGTIVGATGRSIPQMIASGVIMGVGSGFQEMGFACILEFCPNKHRLRYSGESKERTICLQSNEILTKFQVTMVQELCWPSLARCSPMSLLPIHQLAGEVPTGL